MCLSGKKTKKLPSTDAVLNNLALMSFIENIPTAEFNFLNCKEGKGTLCPSHHDNTESADDFAKSLVTKRLNVCRGHLWQLSKFNWVCLAYVTAGIFDDLKK